MTTSEYAVTDETVAVGDTAIDADLYNMTDRQLLLVIAQSQRNTQRLVEQFIGAMQKNPMLKMMAGKIGL